MRPFLFFALLILSSAAFAQDPSLGRLDAATTKGIQELTQGQTEQAAKSLSIVVTGNPDNYVGWYYLGLAQHGLGDLDAAMRSHLLAASLSPKGNRLVPNALYNAACVHALQGRKERAFQYLHRSRNLGYGDAGHLSKDTDLKSLQADPRFASMVANLVIKAPQKHTLTTTITDPMPGQTGGLTVGSNGTVLVADFTSTVWRIGADGKPTKLADGFTKAAGCVIGPSGHLFQVDHAKNSIWRISPDGSKENLGIKGLRGPVGIASGPDGSLWVTNYHGQSIMRITSKGVTSVVSEGGLLSGPNGVVLTPEGVPYVVNFNDGSVIELQPDGKQRLVAVLPGRGNGHLVWHKGGMYITARASNQIYHVTPLGAVTLVAGSGQGGIEDGAPAQARFGNVNGIGISPDGSHLYVNDRANQRANEWVLRKISLTKERKKFKW